MARQVQQMFPRYPLSTIISDLQMSRSMEITIDNILEGRLLVPGGRFEFDDDAPFGDNTPHSSNEPHLNELSRHSSDPDSTSNNSSNSSTTNSISSTNSSLNLADIGYEIERSTNIFGNHNDLLRDER